MQRDIVKIAVIGGGAFGTAMATMAARAGHEVHLYVRDENQANLINTTRTNPKYLTEFQLHESISASTDLISVLNGALLVILSIPAQTVLIFSSSHSDRSQLVCPLSA
jgi:glycerol-3-phosphate dehydrogenase (NAD(P)+)